MVAAHCGGCHAPGGFAPFSLTSYDEARGYAALAAAATKSGEMPPWPPAAGCGDFAGARTLSAAEIAVFAAWNQAGAPAGDPSGAPSPPPAAGADLGPPSVTLDPGDSYRPNAATSDDYHCFLVDPGLSSAQDLDRLRRPPGDAGQRAPRAGVRGAAGAVAEAQSKDAAEPGLGWTCFAGSGLGSRTDAPPTIGGWVPGAGASAVPGGTGIRLDAGTWIVVQVHYNLLAGAAFADRTTVDLHYAATPVAKRALVLPISNATFVIPPGASDTVTAELPVPVGSWSVWGVLPHMHLHGTDIKLSVQHAGGRCDLRDRHPPLELPLAGLLLLQAAAAGRGRRRRSPHLQLRQHRREHRPHVGREDHRRDVPRVRLRHRPLGSRPSGWIERRQRASGHRNAAPRTPLASPCAARTSCVRRSLGTVQRSHSFGTLAKMRALFETPPPSTIARGSSMLTTSASARASAVLVERERPLGDASPAAARRAISSAVDVARRRSAR